MVLFLKTCFSLDYRSVILETQKITDVVWCLNTYKLILCLGTVTLAIVHFSNNAVEITSKNQLTKRWPVVKKIRF